MNIRYLAATASILALSMGSVATAQGALSGFNANRRHP